MSRKMVLEFEKGGRVTATLLDKEAPKTCKVIWDSLPVEHRVLHAMWAGEEFFFDGFPISTPLEFENATNTVKPGYIMTGASCIVREGKLVFNKGETTFAMFYGVGRPRKSVNETIDLNLFALADNVELLAQIGRRIRKEGGENIRITRLE